MNAWLIVLIAGRLETGWALGLKYSDGFSKPIPSVLTILGAIASFWLLSIAMKELPVGTAYAVWVGIGAVGTAVLKLVRAWLAQQPGKAGVLGAGSWSSSSGQATERSNTTRFARCEAGLRRLESVAVRAITAPLAGDTATGPSRWKWTSPKRQTRQST